MKISNFPQTFSLIIFEWNKSKRSNVGSNIDKENMMISRYTILIFIKSKEPFQIH